MRHLIRVALSMSPAALAKKAWAHGVRRLGGAWAGLISRRRDPYVEAGPDLVRRFAQPLAAPGAPEFLANWRAHRFDLLGSGWVEVAHPQAGAPDWRERVAAEHWPAAQRRAARLLGLIHDPGYRPIDWQADFKSGFRWSTRTWGRAVAYGHRPGVDVKVPWELARLQHLPVMALAGVENAAEFRHQVLDFLGGNPPGWGVNWACAMDVAIRGANIALAWDLFSAAGADFDAAFEAELSAGLLAHARHVLNNLEDGGGHRGNHYLSDICGLAFCAATLGEEELLDYCRAELAAEIPAQFLPDGANFEASTSYHRLSAEMAIYAAALLGGLGTEAMARLSLVSAFSAAATKPSGEVVQVGDNDSGRFFALSGWGRALDHSGLMAAARGLFDMDGPSGIETQVVAALAKGKRFAVAARPLWAAPNQPDPKGQSARLRLIPPDPAALEGLEALAFPDFGLFIWKGARAFVSLRCGPIGQNGNGGHAHNDQLAVEIEIDGIPWVRDPGTYVYTPDLDARNRYRSALAHFVPRKGAAEPARFLSPFSLEDRAKAEILRFGPDEALGVHHGFGAPVWRRVAIAGGAVVVEDWPGDGAETEIRSPAELAALWGLDLPFSPGYGIREA